MRISIRIGLGAAAAFAAVGLTAGVAGAAVDSVRHTATGVVKNGGSKVEVTLKVAAGQPDQTCTIALAPAANAGDQDVIAKEINAASTDAADRTAEDRTAEDHMAAADSEPVVGQDTAPVDGLATRDVEDAHATLKAVTIATADDVDVTAGASVVKNIDIVPAKARKSYALSVICDEKTPVNGVVQQNASTAIVSEAPSATGQQSAPGTGQSGNGSLSDALNVIAGDLPNVLAEIIDSVLGGTPAA